jgi:uncharacterized BrkB/YihY/UPF0761 family membrane protein
MTQLSETINIEYFYSVLASILGYTLLYSYAPSKLKIREFIRNIITVCAVGAIALAISESYYPANSDMVNITVIPFISGFVMPHTIAALAKILQMFSKDPVTGLGVIAKLIAVVKGISTTDKTDKKDGESK